MYKLTFILTFGHFAFQEKCVLSQVLPSEEIFLHHCPSDALLAFCVTLRYCTRLSVTAHEAGKAGLGRQHGVAGTGSMSIWATS